MTGVNASDLTVLIGSVTAGAFFIGLFVHKISKHGDKHPESSILRKYFNENGSYEVWQEVKDKNVFHHIIDMGDGLFGDYIVYQNGDTMYEKTIFSPKNGTLPSVRKYVSSKAVLIIRKK